MAVCFHRFVRMFQNFTGSYSLIRRLCYCVLSPYTNVDAAISRGSHRSTQRFLRISKCVGLHWDGSPMVYMQRYDVIISPIDFGAC